MFQRLVFTFATAGGLIGLAVLYSVAMRPIVVIPVRDEPKVSQPEFTETQRPAENVRVAAKYIPFSEWATDSKYMFRAEQAFVYTDEWRRDETSNKRVKFTPFAMVWLSTDKAGNEQAVSVASESATLVFASEFDEKSPNPGRVVGAILSGPVKITGPDGLDVEGHDFFFEEEGLALFTTNQVDFRFQSNYGTASQMQMKLIPAEGLPSPDRPHVYGVESIRLIGGKNPVTLRSKMPQGKTTRPVILKCAGDLVYTVASSTAVFNDDIRVWAGSHGVYDFLNCDRLTVQFAPKKTEIAEPASDATSPPQDQPPAGRDFQKFETNLEFSWLEAEADAGKEVQIRSPSYGVKARMNRLTYSAESQTLAMDSKDRERPVSVVRNGSELWAPMIEAHLLPGEANPLASLLCIGKGELCYVDEKTNRVAFRARWKKQLSKKLDPETNLDLIELDEGAVFSQPDRQTGLAAHQIRIWLVPIAFSVPDPGGDATEQSATPEPEPKRLLALGAVAFKSPQLVIEERRTNELEILFVDDETTSPAAVNQSSRLPRIRPAMAGQAHLGRDSVNPAGSQPIDGIRNRMSKGFEDGTAKTGLVLPVAQTGRSRTELRSSELMLTENVEPGRRPRPAATADSLARGSTKTSGLGFASISAIPDGKLGPPIEIPSEASAEPIVVLAKHIAVHLQRLAGRSDPVVREVHADGKVTITQERKRGEKPMRLEGDRVDVKTESEKHEVVDVLGNPALIQDREFEIVGKNIHLNRGTNLAWVDGAGQLSIVVPAETKIPGMETNLQRTLRVRWDESMNFDGLAAKFFGRVEAKLGLGKMQCGQMVVELASRLSFQADSLETNPTLQRVYCLNKVSFENSKYLLKNVDEIYRGWVSEFEVDLVTGDVKAQGPGEIRFWQRHKNGGELALQDAIQANRPIPVEVTVWDYTGVQFEGKLKGRFDGPATRRRTHERATVDDRVEVIYGPVKSPSERIDPDNLPSRGGTIRCDKLTFVNHPVSERTNVEWRELVGKGNTEIEGQVDGRRFGASADEIIYDGLKGLYVLRAYGPRQTAKLSFVDSKAGRPISQTGRTITFNPDPKVMYLTVDQATEGQGSQ